MFLLVVFIILFVFPVFLFFALNSAITNEDIGRPCASAICGTKSKENYIKFARKCGKSALSQ